MFSCVLTWHYALVVAKLILIVYYVLSVYFLGTRSPVFTNALVINLH